MNEDRWKNLKNFVAEWYRPLTEADGLPLEQIEAAEKSLGFRLPDALRELYQLIGGNKDLTGRQNYLTKIEDLQIEDGYLWVWDENQGVWVYGIAENDLTLSDPPTQLLMDGECVESESGKPLSDLALVMIALDLVMAGEHSALGSAGPRFGIDPSVPYDKYEGIINEMLSRGKPSPYPILAENRFFIVEGVLALPDSNGLFIAAPDRQTLLEAVNKLDQLDWSCNSIEDN
jgi:hypothetical protein